MPDRPLYVRLPEREAELLERAALAGRTSKRQIVTSLVQQGLADDGPLTVDGRDLGPTGRHDFSASSSPEVLTLDQAAELLLADPAEIEQLASKGELPGRRIGGEWRFSRAALLDWLSGR